MRKTKFRSYLHLDRILEVIRIFSWILITSGVLLSIIGAMGSDTPYGQSALFYVFMGALPGLSLLQAGLVNLVITSIAILLVDKARMAQEMLTIARNEGRPITYDKEPSPAWEPEENMKEGTRPSFVEPGQELLLETYKGIAIVKRSDGTYVGDRRLSGLITAKDYIDAKHAGDV